MAALAAAESFNFYGPRGREDSFGLIPVHFSAVLCRRRLSLWSINPRWVEEGDEEAAKTVASSWGQDWGSDTMNCTSLALGGCVRGSLVVGATTDDMEWSRHTMTRLRSGGAGGLALGSGG